MEVALAALEIRELPKTRGPLIMRTPTKRTLNLYKQPSQAAARPSQASRPSQAVRQSRLRLGSFMPRWEFPIIRGAYMYPK